MSDTDKTSGLQLRSLITKSGQLELSLARVPLPEPGPEQVLVRVEATPINPSDLGLLLGPADLTSFKSSGNGDDRRAHRCPHVQVHGVGRGLADAAV